MNTEEVQGKTNFRNAKLRPEVKALYAHHRQQTAIVFSARPCIETMFNCSIDGVGRQSKFLTLHQKWMTSTKCPPIWEVATPMLEFCHE